MRYDSTPFNLSDISLQPETLVFNSHGKDYRIPIADITTPQMFGAKGNGVTDDTDALQRMSATRPRYVDWGNSDRIYRIVKPLVVDYPTYWVGRKPEIKYDWTYDGFIQNMVRIEPGAEFSRFEGLLFNPDAMFAPIPWLRRGVPLILCDGVRSGCNDVTFVGCEVRRSHLNGFSCSWGDIIVGDGKTVDTAFDTLQHSFFPLRNRIIDCHAFECGYGDVTDKFIPEFDTTGLLFRGGGAGYNLLNGSRNQIIGCSAERCSIGLTTDFGGGAVSNIISDITITSSGYAFLTADHPFNGSGTWFGSPQNIYINMISTGNYRHGFIIDPLGYNSSMTNLMAYNCGQHGFHGSANHTSFVNCSSHNSSILAPGVYSGFHAPVGATPRKAFTMLGCVAESVNNTHKYGLDVATGSSGVYEQSSAIGCFFQGATADTNLGATGFVVV